MEQFEEGGGAEEGAGEGASGWVGGGGSTRSQIMSET
jgi:hypothetical protein